MSDMTSVKAIFEEYAPSLLWVTYFFDSSDLRAGRTVPGDIPVSSEIWLGELGPLNAR